MIVKAVTILIALALLAAMVGRLIGPGRPRRPGPVIEAARKCPECGDFVVGADPAPCARGTCPYH